MPSQQLHDQLHEQNSVDKKQKHKETVTEPVRKLLFVTYTTKQNVRTVKTRKITSKQ